VRPPCGQLPISAGLPATESGRFRKHRRPADTQDKVSANEMPGKKTPVQNLREIVPDRARLAGACSAGIATVETLAGGPEPADLERVRPGAGSALSSRKEERVRRHGMLTGSGVVVQNEDGSLEALTPGAARERIPALTPERRALVETD